MSDYIPFEVFVTFFILLATYVACRGADRDSQRD
jgi:hypothetical protein